MEFLFDVVGHAYSFFYGVYAILKLSINDLVLLSSVNHVVTITSFVNVFTHSTITLAVSDVVWAIISIPITLTQPIFYVLGVDDVSLGLAFLIVVPVFVIIGSIVNALFNIIRD